MKTFYDRAEEQIPAARLDAALAGASPTPFWLDDPSRPEPLSSLRGTVTADLAVVGGGYTGLWTALLAKERDPDRSVVLLEGNRIGWAASGRNGGFCEASLTHGSANGQRHLPGENELLDKLGLQNLDEIEESLARYGIDAGFERTGTLSVATEEHHVGWLAEEAAEDPALEFLDQAAVQQQVASPAYRAGLRDRRGTAMVHPAKLAWGLRDACLRAGVGIYEHTPARSLSRRAGSILLGTDAGSVAAGRVALATNAFPSLLARTRLHTVPVYDYALMTEPLTGGQRESLGWSERFGIADNDNRFHYYRLTTDADGQDRMLFGGYDAVYHYGRSLRHGYDHRPETYRRLAAHFAATFPQLADVRFSHAWGGAIDTCSRFFSFFDTAYAGRVAYCAGFTGLGVGASRFGANVMLDLLSGRPTERTELELVRRKPLPFPPEPLAWLGIKLTTAALIRADRNRGRRGPWLKAMDAAGMGFDS